MKRTLRAFLSLFLLASSYQLAPAGRLFAQQERVAALKQSLAENQKRLRQYKWIETTVIKMKGEEKSRVQKLCFYGAGGQVQKQQLTAPPPQQNVRGIKGRIVEKKKEEVTGYMQEAAALVHQYVPPDPQRIQAAAAAGNLSISPAGPGAARLELRNYLKPGDSVTFNMDTATNSMQAMKGKSYLQTQQDPVTLNVTFARLSTGVSHPANTVLDAPAKNIQVVVQNSDYELAAPQSGPTSMRPPGSSVSPVAFHAEDPDQAQPATDKLTAPIALYPDALIAQILTASTRFEALQSFAAWMKKNPQLKGTELQDAAQKAGFDSSFVALAPFNQVIDMMIRQPEWTKQLGQAFTSNRTAVFDSIQRLRAEAQAAGNLKTTAQQQVQTQTTPEGQQVIVIEPANPQVVYVPTYNPQTVYVSSPSYGGAAAAGAIGFTTGVILGASSNHYYYGPYGWHGAAMYNEAWDHREDYLEQRQDVYQQNSAQRQSAAQSRQTQRQSGAQDLQAQRQAGARNLQAQRQAGAQDLQAQRQASAATSSLGSGQFASQRSGVSSSAFSGYGNGSDARAQSMRGSGSLASSGGFRGGGRRR